MKPTLVPGVRAEIEHRVVTQHLLNQFVPGGPPVFATPWMLSAMETAAYEAIAPHLDEGEVSVGVGFHFEHLAPTPAGMIVVASAEVTHVEGNRVTLAIEARDELELIGRGTHVRAVLDAERFMRRIRRKQGA
jgi:fluoroacetyl-CoA thioesterase